MRYMGQHLLVVRAATISLPSWGRWSRPGRRTPLSALIRRRIGSAVVGGSTTPSPVRGSGRTSVDAPRRENDPGRETPRGPSNAGRRSPYWTPTRPWTVGGSSVLSEARRRWCPRASAARSSAPSRDPRSTPSHLCSRRPAAGRPAGPARCVAATWRSPCHRARAGQSWLGTGPAQAAIGCEPGVPLPSLLPVASGRSIGDPLAAAARAGARPAQAKTNASSPLRNRWQRTPPVARPLPGYSGASPSPRPALSREGGRGTADGDHHGHDPGRARRTTPRTGPSGLIPAMPPPLRPWGAPGRGEVQQLGIAADEQSSSSPVELDGADDLVAVLQPVTSHSSCRASGFTPSPPPAGCRPGPVGAGRTAQPRSPVGRAHQVERQAALEVRVVRRVAGRQVQDWGVRRAREVSAPISPAGGTTPR